MVFLAREVTTFSINGGAEVAQIGWWLAAPPEALGWDTIVGRLNGAPDWFFALAGRFPLGLTRTGRRLDQVDATTGLKFGERALEMPAVNTGTGDTGSVPPQLSIVVSVVPTEGSPRGRGRFYLPMMEPTSIAVTGRLQLEARDDLLEALGTYFEGWDVDDDPPVLGTFSRTAPMAFRGASSIRIGDVIDTQRRRRDAMAESYASWSL
jgi:hypothetical protein